MKRFLTSLALMTLAACGSAVQPVAPLQDTYTAASGVAQKGPLAKGSTVTAAELNASLSPAGEQFSYQVTTNLGAFVPASTFTSEHIGLNASGHYFDEVQNAVSTGTVTLTGYSDLAVDKVLNVNLLTTLEYQRIQNLVTSGMTFAAARTEAENEVLAALNIPSGSYGAFSTLDLSGATDGDHILSAISCLFVYGNSSGPLSQLIANFQSDIGTYGVITNAATKAALIAAAKAINPTAIAANLTAEYASAGVTFSAAKITEWIAQSGDGVIGKFAFQVPDATPTSVFTFPAFVVTQFAGTPVRATAGQLAVNGTSVSGTVTFNSGNTVTLTPGTDALPNGVLTAYLATGGTTLAKVSFISGLVSITVTPATPSVPVGLTQQFKATGTFSDTSTLDLTNLVTWTSSAPNIADVNATSGLATSFVAGSTVVKAASGSVSGSTTLNVTSAIVQSISITPSPDAVKLGTTTQLTAIGTYSDGTTAIVTSVADWTSGTPSVATVGPTTGLATGVSPGSSTISAAMGSITATASLSVITDTWFPTGSMSTARFAHSATLLPNGTVLVAGGAVLLDGDAADTILDSAEIYNPNTGTWTLTGNLTARRMEHTATLLPNGTVLVAGGGGEYAWTSAETYNPSTGTWTPTGSLTTGREGHTATLLPNGTVLVAGGTAIDITVLASAEIYNPSTGIWTPTGSLATARVNHTATLLPNGTVLVAGGINPPIGVLASAEIYDPGTGTWTSTASLIVPVEDHTATLLPNGTVLVAGGMDPLWGVYFTAQIYDPVAGTWAATGNLTSSRAYHTATLLTNGTVLAAGGISVVCPCRPVISAEATAEIYNPNTGIWTPTGNLTTARSYHSATLLQNGLVLVAGGYDYSDAEYLAGAEIYY
jgi:uncharacterized protein YjdB